MRYSSLLAILVGFAAFTLAAGAQSDSAPSGDSARVTTRDTPVKTPVKVYDNDNLPSDSAVETPATTPTGASAPIKPCDDSVSRTGPDGNITDQENAGEIKVGQSPKEREKAYATWRNRISEKKEEVDRLAKELDDLRANPPQSVAVLHIWPDDQKYMLMLQEKQKTLNQSRAELTDPQEEAHKAGVPSSLRD